ncbi:MAG: amidohydrolase family protein [Thermodesulfobacteriota bacterium]
MTVTGSDLAVKGGILVNGREMFRADLFIKDGRVESVEPAEGLKTAARIIDASGKLVLPGIIDAHLHPVYADRMDTLSRSAAFGGVTTLIPFIGAIKAWGQTGTLLDAVLDFIKEGEKDSLIDFGVHCSLCHDDMETVAEVIPRIADLGVISFKAFMAYSKRGMKLSDQELMKVMEIVSASQAIFAVHAESGDILDYLEENYAARSMIGPEYYLPTHPNITEAEAVFRVLTLAQVTNCPMYLPHLSAAESLDVVRLFRKWGGLPALYTETCTHYLTLTDAEMKKMGTLAKVGPPLRQARDVEAMWDAVAEGLIDVIASDTAGYLMKAKEPVWGDVYKAPSGLPGMETVFTVTYDEAVNKGRITLPKLIQLMCENPAHIFGLYPQKGVLEPGSDADLVVFDPTAAYTVSVKDHHGKVDYSMYEGRRGLGRPTLVMQRGQVLVEGGELRAASGQGKYLPGRKFKSEESSK